MSADRDLPARPSLASLRKQAKRLARDVAAGDEGALARVRAHLPSAPLPLSRRDAQVVVAREYGFAGWSALTAEVAERLGTGVEWAASRARAAIHDGDHERLGVLLADHPGLVAWRDADGQSLLDATTSYAMDCSDPERERMYTRPVAAGMLLDAGARLPAHTLEHVLRTGSRGMLALLSEKGALPRALPVLAALGDAAAVDAWPGGPVDADDPATDRGGAGRATVGQAFLNACRFGHADLAVRLLDRAIAVDPALGRRIDAWRDRDAFIEFLASRPDLLWHEIDPTPWETFVVLQLADARDRQDLEAFRRWLDDEPWVLGPLHVRVQADLMLPACYQKGGEPFIAALLERDPAILQADPPPTPRSSLLVQALSYGNAHLVPLLVRIWPLPDDLPHAAGVGDAAAVAGWFDDAGRPILGSLPRHYPASDPDFPRTDLRWGPPTTQQVLDVALAWAVLNGHFAIAETLLRAGADIDTDWATHEPASILHEAAIQGNEPAVRFLVDHGADLTKTDHRFEATAEGWARYGAGDEAMADLLAEAAERRAR